jgi:hypothetical protein
MGIIGGNDSKLQIGIQTDWSTAVSPTLQLSFTQESLRYIPNYMSEDALVGNKTTGRMDPAGVKTEGDFTVLVKPDEIGLLLSWALGSEAAASAVDGSAVYDHAFSLIAGGTSNSLPKATLVVDRKVDTYDYVGFKVNTFRLEANVNDYLRATFGGLGYDEVKNVELASLTPSSLKALQFKHGTITVDASEYADITSFSIDLSNNLEDDLYTMGSGDNMAEIEPQAREVTASMEVLFSSTTESTRENKFKAGDSVAVEATFTSDEEVLTGKYYTLTIDMPLFYITEASPSISGPERIRMTLEGTATEDDSNEAITITLRDGQDTKYIT